jgi:hypothetical protein
MSESLAMQPDSSSKSSPSERAPIDDARVEAFLAEIERAAERLRELPLTNLTPETPYRPEWAETAK